MTPTRSLSTTLRSNLASAIASSEATIAYCVNLSIRLTNFLSMNWVASKFFNSHANLVLNFSVSKYVIGAAPLSPLTRASQYSSLVFPIGVRAPNPVTTTRLNSIKVCYLFCCFYIRDSLTNCSDVFCLVIWNLDIKFFFEFHDQFYGIQRICS